MNKGLTLIETVVAVGVLIVFFALVFFLLYQILNNIGYAQIRSVGLSIGQTQIELIRNLPYNSVGTIGGIPPGPIPQQEQITRNTQTFTVKTDIIYIDDPFDNTAPNDPIPSDYKRVRVQVSWGEAYPSRMPVTFVTNIAPNGIESNPGGGTLFVQVINAQGNPVPNATVQFMNTSVNPAINYNTLTNMNGNVVLPGAPSCVTCYKITTTKDGYSTDRTYGTEEVANPILPHATVIEGQVTQLTFAIDQVGSIQVRSFGSQANGYPPVANVLFTLRGSKIIGTDTTDTPVYKYSYRTNTGGGMVSIPNLEWDNYTIDLSDSHYTLAGSTPTNPITLSPGQNRTVDIVVEPKYNASLLITLKDQMGNLIGSGSANIKNSINTIDSTKFTPASGSPDYGQLFFNNLPVGLYYLIASATGYQSATSSMNITTNTETTLILQ